MFIAKLTSLQPVSCICWFPLLQSELNENGKKEEHLELAFEYLLRKDQMQWITIYSDDVST